MVKECLQEWMECIKKYIKGSFKSMKKLYIIIIAVILLVTIIIGFTIKNHKTHEKYDDTVITQYNVDELINKLVNSDEYNKMSENEKKIECEKLLEKLKENDAIKDYYYSDSEKLYSFEYTDGSLGGITIKEFDTEFN